LKEKILRNHTYFAFKQNKDIKITVKIAKKISNNFLWVLIVDECEEKNRNKYLKKYTYLDSLKTPLVNTSYNPNHHHQNPPYKCSDSPP